VAWQAAADHALIYPVSQYKKLSFGITVTQQLVMVM
jgi:hypothetical protein